MANQRQIKRMLVLNPGSPREQSAKRRLAANKEARSTGGVMAEQRRRLQFNPKRVGR